MQTEKEIVVPYLLTEAHALNGGKMTPPCDPMLPAPAEYHEEVPKGPMQRAVDHAMLVWLEQHPESTHLEQNVERARIWEGMKYCARQMICWTLPPLLYTLARNHLPPVTMRVLKGRQMGKSFMPAIP